MLFSEEIFINTYTYYEAAQSIKDCATLQKQEANYISSICTSGASTGC